jgi:hypothetical protein
VAVAHLTEIGIATTGLVVSTLDEPGTDRTVLADALEPAVVAEALSDVDAVVHLAAIPAPNLAGRMRRSAATPWPPCFPAECRLWTLRGPDPCSGSKPSTSSPYGKEPDRIAVAGPRQPAHHRVRTVVTVPDGSLNPP